MILSGDNLQMHRTATQIFAANHSSLALKSMPMALACLAICGPAWLARNLPPSATFFNQATALLGWAALLALTSWGLVSVPRKALRRPAPRVRIVVGAPGDRQGVGGASPLR